MQTMADSAAGDWNSPARAERRKNPVKSDTQSITAGKAVYAAQCADCHGNSGKGDGPTANDLSVKPKDLSDSKSASQSDGALFWKISTGRKPMPKFDDDAMSETDRWNVINYVRTLNTAQHARPATQASAGQ